ncbi:ead/Ea22-like family protein [Enterobacter hormaechei subsp. steigerwaltii]|nr:ead/Ea22-like family protein [Enterobacter hormaechei]MCU2413945.1 ead/Ea22-like family protein [Enterobacter hormaechei subsp. steigerwaltii]MCU2975531.1 ead/Ea22-like family protein [Enterobacter hormaechei subsp. steigerwaltii]MCU3093594.1 ead/Ea22-like family protein [Enterobacter hormaechei subsp. steigerwaltii]MCU3216222.1 ead/Ea22-like family protein [Enterobacter hormaechei subsp. steigerwaltii]
MSNIDKQALRDIAAAVESAPLWHAVGVFGEVVDPAKPEWKPVHDFCKTFTAERVLALLDELEAADRRIAELSQKADIYDMLRQDYELHGSLVDFVDWQAKRIAELEARRAPDSFNIIGENIRAQDNRITSEPMFCVFQKREIVVDEDYDCDRIVWVDEEGCEATERKRMRLELLHDNCRETPDKWRRIAVKDIDDFVTCCFTEQGCKDYLACNGHNLRLPFIYVKSGFRNAEYIGIRNWLAGIGKGE